MNTIEMVSPSVAEARTRQARQTIAAAELLSLALRALNGGLPSLARTRTDKALKAQKMAGDAAVERAARGDYAKLDLAWAGRALSAPTPAADQISDLYN